MLVTFVDSTIPLMTRFILTFAHKVLDVGTESILSDANLYIQPVALRIDVVFLGRCGVILEVVWICN